MVRVFSKIRKVYPLLNVLMLLRVARPLGFRQYLRLYYAPLLWLLHGGVRGYWELLPEHLLLDSKYGLFYTHALNIGLLFQESYEVDRVVPNLVDEGSVFVDVGAYMGLYTIWACRRAKLVVTVEPNPWALAYLRANIALNRCDNVKLVPKALSDKKGCVELRVPRPREEGLVPSSPSIVWDFEDAIRLSVESDTLDNVLSELGVGEVDLLKVDVEGAEGLVVKGAQETLRRTRAVLIEIWPENLWIVDHLRSLGFKLKRIVDHMAYRNYLFIKANPSSP